MKNRVPCGMRRHPVFISDGWLAKFDSDATAAGKGDLQLGVGGDDGLGYLVALGILVPGCVLSVGVDGGGVFLSFGQGELGEVDDGGAGVLVVVFHVLLEDAGGVVHRAAHDAGEGQDGGVLGRVAYRV